MTRRTKVPLYMLTRSMAGADFLGCPKDVLDVEPRRRSSRDILSWSRIADWVGLLGSMGVCAVSVHMRASRAAWPAKLIRSGVLPSTACAWPLVYLFSSPDLVLSPDKRSLRIRRDTTITRRSKIQKQARWATARFAWTR